MPHVTLRVDISKSAAAFNILYLPKVSKRLAFLKLFPEYNQSLDKLRQLLSAAALGELDKAEAIWSKDPSFLSCRGTVYHPNCDYTVDPPRAIPLEKSLGRYKYVDRTAWQILCMNEEWEEAKKAGEYMTKEEKEKQLAEIFPDGELVKHHWSLGKAMKQLYAVFNAINHDEIIDSNDISKMNIETRNTLQALYDYVKPAPENNTGLVFDVTIYLAALEFSKNIGFKKGDKQRFWNVRVEEVLASLLPTGYLRPHSQNYPEQEDRSGCILYHTEPYFSFRRSSNSLPGADFWVGLYWLLGNWSSRSYEHEWFLKLDAAKKIARADFMLEYTELESRAKHCI